MINIKQLLNARQGDNLSLHNNISPMFAKVLSTIGFDKNYTRAAGMSLWDDAGREYYDFLAGYGVFAIGRNHAQMKKILHEFLDMDTASLVQMEPPLLSGLLAERLIEKFGHGVRDTVYFTNSGTEAIESAIKFVRCATGREKILFLDHAFHGLSTGALSINGNTEFREGFGTLLPGDKLDMNNLDTLEEKLKTREYAAFIFEPIQGKGVYIPQKNYLKQARELCHQYGTLMIADEVQTGLGRTGKWLAIDHFEIEPDLICISKALSGGFVPVGAVIYRREIYHKVFSRMDRCVVHSSTFGQGNMAMACGLATLDIIEEENLINNAQQKSEIFITKLLALKQRHEWISDVRGKGLMIGIEMGKPTSFKKKIAWDMVHKVDKGLFGELVVMPLLAKHGIIAQVSGHHQDIVKLIPPLIIQDKHIDYFVNAIDEVLTSCDKVSGPIFTMGKNLAKHVMG